MQVDVGSAAMFRRRKLPYGPCLGWIIQTRKPHTINGDDVQFAVPSGGMSDYHTMIREVLCGMNAALHRECEQLETTRPISVRPFNLEVLLSFSHRLFQWQCNIPGARSFFHSKFMTKFRLKLVNVPADMSQDTAQFFPPVVDGVGGAGGAAVMDANSGGFLSAAPCHHGFTSEAVRRGQCHRLSCAT